MFVRYMAHTYLLVNVYWLATAHPSRSSIPFRQPHLECRLCYKKCWQNWQYGVYGRDNIW